MFADPPNTTTLGYNEGDTVASSNKTLATATCHVKIGEYTDLLNPMDAAMQNQMDVESILTITTDLRTMTTGFSHIDEKTYYQFVHGGQSALAAYAKVNGDINDSMPGDTFFQRFRRRLAGCDIALTHKDAFPNKLIHHIMQRMFSQTAEDKTRAYLSTVIFSVEKVQTHILTPNADKITECALRNWIDPSKIVADSDFIVTHRSSQDNAILVIP